MPTNFLRYDNQHKKCDGDIHFHNIVLFHHFSGTSGVNLGWKRGKIGENGQELPISSINNDNNLQTSSDIIFSMLNVIMTSIFTILYYFTTFPPIQGSSGGSNRGKWATIAHFFRNDDSNLQIPSEIIFNTQNLIMASISVIFFYFTTFPIPQGSSRG